MKNLDTAADSIVTYEHFEAAVGEAGFAPPPSGIGGEASSQHHHVFELGAAQSGLPYYWSGGVPCAADETRGRSVSLACKRVADLLMAIAALVALAPLLLGLVLVIKATSTGPVFFRQSRVGFRGAMFDVLKFRSMYTDRCDISGVDQITESDARVTPIGRFMRKTSLDELPQLINVLRGEMSMVGPRPHVAGMLAGAMPYEQLVPYYGLRHAMRPGITGWAQANGLRGPTRDARLARRRIDHDIAYIQNFSLLLDFKVILLTIRNEFLTGSGV